MSKEKVVLAYSGGLDTSIIIPWLKENYDYDVICVCGDVGQGKELEPLNEKGITLSYDKNVPLLLAKEAEKGNKGARDLRNVIRRQIEDKITNAIVENFETKLTKVDFKVKDDELIFKAK